MVQGIISNTQTLKEQVQKIVAELQNQEQI